MSENEWDFWDKGSDYTDRLPEEATLDQVAEFAREVDREAYRLRVREAARAKVAAEKAPEAPPFDAGLLVDVRARPAEPPYRVEGLMPSDADTLVVAQRKTGKTTFDLNLARCLVTGEAFLGSFPVRRITGRVGFLNYEVSAAQLARWADEVGVPADRLYLVNLRGRRNPLGNVEDRELLAARLRDQEVESLIVDPFGRAFTGKSQNDSGEVGAWLADLDRFARAEAGAVDVIVSAHAGWEGERSRGASALEDWADCILTMTRSQDDGDPARFLRATGRDVDIEEDRLDYDPTTRRLSLTGAGSRKAVAKTRHLDDLVPAVVEVVTATPGLTGYKLADALRDAGEHFQRGDPVRAARVAVDSGELRIEDGPRNSKRYFPAHLSPPIPTYPDRDTSPPIPTSLYRGGVGGTGQVEVDLSQALLDDLPATTKGCPGCGISIAAHLALCVDCALTRAREVRQEMAS